MYGTEPQEDITIYITVASLTYAGNTSCCVTRATEIFLIISFYGAGLLRRLSYRQSVRSTQTPDMQRKPHERLKGEICQAVTVIASREDNICASQGADYKATFKAG